jgi:hypothetical protein
MIIPDPGSQIPHPDFFPSRIPDPGVKKAPEHGFRIRNTAGNTIFKCALFCRIKHFAGSVTYNVEGFLEKNRDTLEADLSRFMFHCQHPLLKLLFPEGELL